MTALNGTLTIPAAELAKLRATDPPGVWRPTGRHEREQVKLWRYGDNQRHPAFGIQGYGPASEIRAHHRTALQPMRSLIVTEDCDKAIRQFQSQAATDNVLPPVLQPFLRDLTLCAHDWKGDDFWGPSLVSDRGQVDPTAAQYDAIRWKASGGLVENVGIFGFPGHAGYFSRGCCPKDKQGGTRPSDSEKLRLRDVEVKRCAKGIEIDVIDAIVGNFWGHNNGEFDLKLTAGATQIAGAIHCWGGGLWLTGDYNWAEAPIYAEHGSISCRVHSNHNQLGKVYGHSATDTVIEVAGTHNVLTPQTNFMTFANAIWQPVGVRCLGQYNTFLKGSEIRVPPNASRGFVGAGQGGWYLDLCAKITGGDGGSVLADFSGCSEGLYGCSIDLFLDGPGVGANFVDKEGKNLLLWGNRVNIRTPYKNSLKTTVKLGSYDKNANVVMVNGVVQ